MKTLELEEKLKDMTAKYESERVKVHYWTKKSDGNPTDESETLKDMKEKAAYLEDKNCTLKDEIDELLNRDYVQTFQNGRYTKEVRQVYLKILHMKTSSLTIFACKSF